MHIGVVYYSEEYGSLTKHQTNRPKLKLKLQLN